MNGDCVRTTNNSLDRGKRSISRKQLWLVLCLALIVVACSTTTQPAPQVLEPTSLPVDTGQAVVEQATVELTKAIPPTEVPTLATPPGVTPTVTATQETSAVSFPLSEPGPYFVGNQSLKFVDESRGGRAVGVTLYYPAMKQTDANGNVIKHKAAPDMSAAPYPIILTGPNSGDMLFQTHLASHGFVTAIVRFPDLKYRDPWDFGVIDHPQDMVFALEQIADKPPAGLEGLVDPELAGVAGYSWDGFFSLALSGVRIDPQYYLSWCEQADERQPPLEDWYIQYACGLANKWDTFAEHVGEAITKSDDGLWQAVTDERIRVVMPMAVDGAWLYGERGLSAVDRPVYMVQAELDSPYQPSEARFIFENLGTPDKSMVSFLGKDHMMVFDPESKNRMLHLATAFLGYYLQNREEYRDYISEDFIVQFDDLAWGLAPGK